MFCEGRGRGRNYRNIGFEWGYVLHFTCSKWEQFYLSENVHYITSLTKLGFNASLKNKTFGLNVARLSADVEFLFARGQIYKKPCKFIT